MYPAKQYLNVALKLPICGGIAVVVCFLNGPETVPVQSRFEKKRFLPAPFQCPISSPYRTLSVQAHWHQKLTCQYQPQAGPSRLLRKALEKEKKTRLVSARLRFPLEFVRPSLRAGSLGTEHTATYKYLALIIIAGFVRSALPHPLNV